MFDQIPLIGKNDVASNNYCPFETKECLHALLNKSCVSQETFIMNLCITPLIYFQFVDSSCLKNIFKSHVATLYLLLRNDNLGLS